MLVKFRLHPLPISYAYSVGLPILYVVLIYTVKTRRNDFSYPFGLWLRHPRLPKRSDYRNLPTSRLVS